MKPLAASEAVSLVYSHSDTANARLHAVLRLTIWGPVVKSWKLGAGTP